MVYDVSFDAEDSYINVSLPSDLPEVADDGDDGCEDDKDNDGDGLIDELDPGCRAALKISTQGDGLCHGSMDHFELDNSVWAFRPTLQEDGTLSGTGTYSLFRSDTF
jgi:hypothetical protein